MDAPHSNVKGKERRHGQLLLEHWRELRGGFDFPSENALDPQLLQQFWPDCFLFQLRDLQAGDKANYTYLGERIRLLYEDNLLAGGGPVISPKPLLYKDRFLQVAETRQPLFESGSVTSLAGNRVRYRQCFLPLGEGGRRVESVLGGLWLK